MRYFWRNNVSTTHTIYDLVNDFEKTGDLWLKGPSIDHSVLQNWVKIFLLLKKVFTTIHQLQFDAVFRSVVFKVDAFVYIFRFSWQKSFFHKTIYADVHIPIECYSLTNSTFLNDNDFIVCEYILWNEKASDILGREIVELNFFENGITWYHGKLYNAATVCFGLD